MKTSKKRGLNFGLTSAVITTLGLMIGLYASTNSKLAVLGGILTIAIADSLSDAMGIHISEEATNNNHKQVWSATKYTFVSKFLLALVFVIPVILLNLSTALIVSIIFGLLVIIYLSMKIAKRERKKPMPIIGEHLAITLFVIITTYLVGHLINLYF